MTHVSFADEVPMKFNLKSLWFGGVAAIALSLTPSLALAQSATDTPNSAPALENLHGLGQLRQQLNLTPDQEAQLRQIGQSAYSQLQTFITPTQLQQFRTAHQQGKTIREAIAAMNLSSQQQDQLRSLFQSTREQMANVLTDTQRQQAREFWQTRRSERRSQPQNNSF
jgi:Spy/CpxP family protein refolding chaperone